eukprot:GFUD01049458.1.p1 GENE.GFUD01049458.1~~GFUD01049458.1.p1  ORF type:complete len:754 (+),score=195.23 GFUD01049458.1:104-2365(+)
MDSEATTPTRGYSANGSSQSSLPSPDLGPTKLRKIVFDDFEIHGEVVYSRDGVIVQAKKEDRLHSGNLQITETKHGAFVTWDLDTPAQQTLSVEPDPRPANEQNGQTDRSSVTFCVGSPPSADWAVIADNADPGTPLGRVRYKSRSNSTESPAVTFSSHLEEKQLKMVVEVTEIRSYRLSDDGNQVTIMMKDGTAHNNLIFLDEGPTEFLESLHKYVSIKRASSDENMFVLMDKRMAALDQSLSELNLVDMTGTNTEVVWRTLSDFQKDPYTTGLSIFSKITDKILFSPGEKEFRPEEEMAELLQGESVGASLEISQSVHNEQEENTDWQLVTNKSRSCVMSKVKACERDAPLCQLDWELHIDSEGMVQEVPQLLEKIFKGGIDENIRSEIWKYLLGYFHWHHPTEVRETNRKARVEEYFRMKLQWKSTSEDQQNRFAAFRERKTQIEKDIGRTDRSHPYYEGDSNHNIALLQDILMTYVMYNFDLGYVQGMSDLLAPILFVMKNEVDAFWCFVGFMDRVASNFEFDQGGMKRQLDNLTEILKFVDPVFYNYLDAKESGNLYFCFRWMLIWFKREFNYSDTMTLWEVLWTKKPCKNFHLLVCAALLDTEKSAIVENKYGFTEILKHVNDMSHRIDLQKTLSKAEGIFESLRVDNKISDRLVNILGLAPPKPASSQNGHNPEELQTGTEDPHRATSKPMPIQNRKLSSNSHARERHRTESSNASSSLNNSSSVEVLSEIDDEQKFENSLNSSFF